MLWLVVPVSRQPAFVHPWGATACFFLLDGKGNGWGERRGTGGVGVLAPRCPCIICGWPISVVCSRGGERAGRSTGQNHRLTVVPWWVEPGVWFPNAAPPRPQHTQSLTQNKHTQTALDPIKCFCLLTHPLTGVRSVRVCACVYVCVCMWNLSWRVATAT